jgi:hypothetical protein
MSQMGYIVSVKSTYLVLEDRVGLQKTLPEIEFANFARAWFQLDETFIGGG